MPEKKNNYSIFAFMRLFSTILPVFFIIFLKILFDFKRI